jgi:hypothetical protein
VDQSEYEMAVSCVVAAAELARARRAVLLKQLADVFARSEPAVQAGKYIDGLAYDLPRNNGWTLVEHAGDATPDRMQRLLSHAVWDHQQATARIRGFVVEHLGEADGVLIADLCRGTLVGGRRPCRGGLRVGVTSRGLGIVTDLPGRQAMDRRW